VLVLLIHSRGPDCQARRRDPPGPDVSRNHHATILYQIVHKNKRAQAADGTLYYRKYCRDEKSTDWRGWPYFRSLFAAHVAKENYLLPPPLGRPRTGLAVLVSREPTLVSRG
jgi:hypothetical protein